MKRDRHTKDLTGPQARAFLEAVRQNLYEGKGREFLLHLAKIEKFAVAKYLNPEQIEEVGQLFQELQKISDNMDVDISSCVKLHCLRYHVWPVIQRFGTWGLISEQCR